MQGFYGDRPKKKVIITSYEPLPFEITEIKSNIDDKIKYKLEKLQEPEKYALEISIPGGIKDSFRGKLLLKTNSEKKPEFEILILAIMDNSLNIVPNYVYFGVIDISSKNVDKKSLERTVRIIKATSEDFRIEKIESSADWIVTKTEISNNGENYTVVIRLNREKLPKGKFRKKVTVHSKTGNRHETGFVIVEGKVK